MRKFLAIALALFVTFSVAGTMACGAKNEAEKPPVKDEKEPSVVYYTVYFDSLGGTEIAEQKVESGKKAQKPRDPVKSAEARKEYVFIGWFTDSGTTWEFENMEVTENLVLTARYKVIAYSQEVLPSE